MSTLRVSNIEAKADVSSPSVHEKIKVTNSEGDVLVHIDGATSGISTVGINTTVKTFDVDSNQNIDFVGNLTAPNITVTGTLSYDDVTNIDSVGVITARSGLEVTSGGLQVVAGNVGIDQANPTNKLEVEGSASVARFVGNRTDALGPRLSLAKSRGSTSGSATIVQDGDEIGQIMFKGADGTDASSTGAAIIGLVDGTPGVNDMPGALTFLTTNDGTNSPTERLRINSYGNVSIGSLTDDSIGSTTTLTIDRSGGNGQISFAANGTVRGRIFADNSTSDFRIGNPTSNGLMLYTNNLERLRIDSSGRIGINQTSPQRTLHIGESGTAEANVRIQGGADHFELRVKDSDNALTIHRNIAGGGSSEDLRIDSSGNVIVNGTATGSNAKFEVQSTTGSISSATLRVTAEKTTTGATNTGSSILLAGHDGSNSRDFASLFAGKENGTGSNFDAYLAFGTRTNGSPLAERVRITSQGRLHLGNSGHGTIKVGGQEISGQDYSALLKLYDTRANIWGMQVRRDTGTGPNGIFVRAGNTSSNYSLYVCGTNEVNTHLVCRGDGNVGIGTDEPDQKVEINGAAKFTRGTSTEGSQMLVLPLEDITLASNASASIAVGSRFTGIIIVAGYTNDTPGGVWAVASASSYSLDAVTRIQFNNHPASNISDLTITSPSHGGTHQFQLNQTGSVTKTYKVFAMGIYG